MQENFYRAVGKKLKELRDENGFSQEYVANILHVSQVAYSRYETGKRQISFETVSTLADFYKVSLDYIACRTD